MTDCEAAIAALHRCVGALSWDHSYTTNDDCGGCVAFTQACDLLGISAEKSEELS